MSKYECRLKCNFNEALDKIDRGIIEGSASASFEDESKFSLGEANCIVRVYERYSLFGGNRVSMTITLFGRDGDIHLSAITAGGSQALFFKVNTIGEESFLNRLIEIIEFNNWAY